MQLLRRAAVVAVALAGVGLVSPTLASAEDRAPTATPQRVGASELQGITSQRIRWQFMRSSWSGFRNYTDLTTGGWVSSLSISGNLYAYCYGGGTYDYKLRYYSDVIYNGQVLNGPYAENTITRTACGTGVS